MLYAVFVLAVVLVGVASAYLFTRRAATSHPFRGTVWRAGLVIAAVRLAILWMSIFFLTSKNGFRQAAGYVLLVLNSLVEMVVAQSLRNTPRMWIASLSLLVLGTSLCLGYGWALVVRRFRSGRVPL